MDASIVAFIVLVAPILLWNVWLMVWEERESAKRAAEIKQRGERFQEDRRRATETYLRRKHAGLAAQSEYERASPRQRESYRINALGHLTTLTPENFERVIAEYLREEGYRQVRRIGGANDQGVDILCLDYEGRLVAVQCKRYGVERKIGPGPIRDFGSGARIYGACQGIFVTTADYTPSARETAHQLNIELIDGKALRETFAWGLPAF